MDFNGNYKQPSLELEDQSIGPAVVAPPQRNLFEKPKRPLSAYNLFFKREREQMLQTASDNAALTAWMKGKKPKRGQTPKIGFGEMAKTISARWKQIDPQEKEGLEAIASVDRARYFRELKEWKRFKKSMEERGSVVHTVTLDSATRSNMENGSRASIPQAVFNVSPRFAAVPQAQPTMTSMPNSPSLGARPMDRVPEKRNAKRFAGPVPTSVSASSTIQQTLAFDNMQNATQSHNRSAVDANVLDQATGIHDDRNAIANAAGRGSGSFLLSREVLNLMANSWANTNSVTMPTVTSASSTGTPQRQNVTPYDSGHSSAKEESSGFFLA